MLEGFSLKTPMEGFALKKPMDYPNSSRVKMHPHHCSYAFFQPASKFGHREKAGYDGRSPVDLDDVWVLMKIRGQ